MATIIGNNQVKLNNGKVVQAQENAWYDGQNFSGGQLGAPGVKISAGVGQGQAVSNEVISQTNPANVAYIQQQQAAYKPQTSTRPMGATPSTYSGTGTAATPGKGAGIGFQAPETINLPKMYESLYASSGIRDTEADLNAKTMAYNEAVAKIKDNPYLSEATMTGRISKLDQKFGADSQAIKNDIATRKADIETKLNLETKQLDINNQATQQAWSQFNTLLSSGALNDASGEDIANLTRATGISSSMINSAINSNKKKDVQTQVIQSTDDSGNVTVSVIDQNTGDIINQQSLGAIGNKQQGREPKEASASEQKAYYVNALKEDAARGVELPNIFNLYSGYLDANDIYSLYNSSSMFGPAKTDYWTPDKLAQYGVKSASAGITF